MKSIKIQIILIIALIFLSMMTITVAQESISTTNRTKITPNEAFLYELELAFDNMQLMIASMRGPKAHSELALVIAYERVIEIERMGKEGNIHGMERAVYEYKKLMDIVYGRTRDIVKINLMNEIRLQINVSQSLAEHRKFVDNVSNRLEINIKNNENIDENRRQQMLSLLEDMRQSTENAEIKLENLRKETRKELWQQTNKELREVDIAIEMIKREQGFIELRDRAQYVILEANTKNRYLNKIIDALKISDQDVLNTSSKAQRELRSSLISYKNNDYNAAIRHASISVTLSEIVLANVAKFQ